MFALHKLIPEIRCMCWFHLHIFLLQLALFSRHSRQWIIQAVNTRNYLRLVFAAATSRSNHTCIPTNPDAAQRMHTHKHTLANTRDQICSRAYEDTCIQDK